MNQTNNQSSKQSDKQSNKQTIKQSNNQSTNRTINQPIEQTINQSVNKPMRISYKGRIKVSCQDCMLFVGFMSEGILIVVADWRRVADLRYKNRASLTSLKVMLRAGLSPHKEPGLGPGPLPLPLPLPLPPLPLPLPLPPPLLPVTSSLPHTACCARWICHRQVKRRQDKIR